jgi:hypothetical protein
MRFTIIISLLAAALGLAACGSSSPSATAANASGGQSSDASSRTLEFASCMRSRGVSNFPDPTIQTGPYGGLAFSVDFGDTGIDPNSPAFQAAQQDCGSLIGAPKTAPAG